MSSPTPDMFAQRAEQARRRALRSRRLGLVASVVALGLGGLFVAQGFWRNAGEAILTPALTKTMKVVGGMSSFAGIDVNNKAFSVKAEKGTQDDKIDSLMHLEVVSGSFIRREGGEVQVKADKASYELKSKDLTLAGNVRFEEPGRYVAHLLSAQVNLEQQRIITNEAVQIETSGASVTADRMETSQDGRRITLQGHVKARFASAGIDD